MLEMAKMGLVLLLLREGRGKAVCRRTGEI